MLEQTNFQKEIRFLHKKFRTLDRPNTKILYEFCQFDAQKTYKILAMLKIIRNPGAVIQTLMKNPEKSEYYLESLVARYDKEIGEPVDIHIQKVEVKKASIGIQKLGFQFFSSVPEDIITRIMSYLDPYSFTLFSITSSSMLHISKSPSHSQLYKQLCLTLFSDKQPKLPFLCQFFSVRKFVLANPLQYYPYFNNMKNAVTNNLRNYIWKASPQDFRLPHNYYKQFGSYQTLFQKCPRVNFNGFYICKHKYVKIGQKNMIHAITPIHVIYYYRYLRFLEDGSIVYYVANRKIKPQNILQHLGKQLAEKQDQTAIVGEFMQFKNTLKLKAAKDNSLFCYDMEIRSNQGRICNELKVISYKLELIDNSEMTQTLFQAHPNKEDIIFNYVFDQSIKQENSYRIQACSL